MKIRFGFGLHSLSVRQVDSEGELREALSRCDAGHVIVGGEREFALHYWEVIVCRCDGDAKFGIGVLVASTGIDPELLVWERQRLLVLICDSIATGVDVDRKTVIFQCDVRVPIYHAFPLRDPDRLVLIHETGAASIDARGSTLWAIATDVVTKWDLDDRQLTLRDMEGHTSAIEVDTGEAVRN